MGCGGSRTIDENKNNKFIEKENQKLKHMNREINITKYLEIKNKFYNFIKYKPIDKHNLPPIDKELEMMKDDLINDGWDIEDFKEAYNNYRSLKNLETSEINPGDILGEILSDLPKHSNLVEDDKSFLKSLFKTQNFCFLRIDKDFLELGKFTMSNLKYDSRFDVPYLGVAVFQPCQEILNDIAEYIEHSKNLETFAIIITKNKNQLENVITKLDDFIPILKSVILNKTIKNFVFGSLNKSLKLSFDIEGLNLIHQIIKKGNLESFALGKFNFNLEDLLHSISNNKNLTSFAIDYNKNWSENNIKNYLNFIKQNDNLNSVALFGPEDLKMNEKYREEILNFNKNIKVFVIDKSFEFYTD